MGITVVDHGQFTVDSPKSKGDHSFCGARSQVLSPVVAQCARDNLRMYGVKFSQFRKRREKLRDRRFLCVVEERVAMDVISPGLVFFGYRALSVPMTRMEAGS